MQINLVAFRIMHNIIESGIIIQLHSFIALLYLHLTHFYFRHLMHAVAKWQ